MSIFLYTWIDCPERSEHRDPEGPNEDVGACLLCGSRRPRVRPMDEAFALHVDGCSGEIDHAGRCPGNRK